MVKDSVWITQYIVDRHIEQEILGDAYAHEEHPGIEVALVWRETVSEAFMSRFPNLRAVS